MSKEEIIKELIGEIAEYSGGMSFKNEKWLTNKLNKALQAQNQDLLKKIEGAENQFKDGYYVFHFTYTSNTRKRIAEINRVNEPLPPDMAYQLAKKHISEFPEAVMDWFVENRGVLHILEAIKKLIK